MKLREEVACFYAACVVAALDSLHTKGYVYRVRFPVATTLKPRPIRPPPAL